MDHIAANLRECVCLERGRLPRRSTHPLRSGTHCEACGFVLGEWADTPARVGEFFTRLELYVEQGARWALPALGSLRAQVEARKRVGYNQFGYRYMQRNNVVEGLEEAADFVLYMLLDELRDRFEKQDFTAELMQAAYFATLAYAAAQNVLAARNSVSLAVVDE